MGKNMTFSLCGQQNSLHRYLINKNYVSSFLKLCIFFLYPVFPYVNLRSSNKVLEIKYFSVVRFHHNLNKAKHFRGVCQITCSSCACVLRAFCLTFSRVSRVLCLNGSLALCALVSCATCVQRGLVPHVPHVLFGLTCIVSCMP